MPKQDKFKEILSKYFPEEEEVEHKSESETRTREYKVFLRESKGLEVTLFERLCNSFGKYLPMQVSKEDSEKIDNSLKVLNIDTSPEYVVGLSILALFAGIMLTLLVLVFSGSLLVTLTCAIIAGLGFFYFKDFPDTMMEIRRAKASSESILAVLYIVIFMRHTPNIESAVQFAAENLTGPLSFDFRKLFWDVETRKFDNVKQALDNYVQSWLEYNRPFVDAIYLIESSIMQKDEFKRLEMLDRAVDHILEGTYEVMMRFSRNLQTPIETLYMMGIMLPVLGLVLLPIVGTFMGEIVSASSIVILYNFILPLGVFLFGRSVLKNRPVGFPPINVENHPQVPPNNYFFLTKDIIFNALIPALVFPVLLTLPLIFYIAGQQVYTPSEADVYFSLIPIVGIGGSLFIYSYLILKDRWYVRDVISKVETEFGDAIFQLGNRLAEGVPVENAFTKVSETMKASSISRFFDLIVLNMKKLGLDLEDAIFDKNHGAINFYPSTLINSIMKILIRASRKSAETASVSMINVSRYLNDIHNIDEKIKDIFGETMASMKFQAAFLTPIVCGIVVGLTAMIVVILFMLQEQITEMAAMTQELGGAGFGTTFIMGFFGMSNAIPLHYFQLVVGIYMIQVVVLISYLCAELESQSDYLSFLNTLQGTIIAGVGIYLIVTFITTFIFAGMSQLVVSVGGGMSASF